jgi:hypothetical protein
MLRILRHRLASSIAIIHLLGGISCVLLHFQEGLWRAQRFCWSAACGVFCSNPH